MEPIEPGNEEVMSSHSPEQLGDDISIRAHDRNLELAGNLTTKNFMIIKFL